MRGTIFWSKSTGSCLQMLTFLLSKMEMMGDALQLAWIRTLWHVVEGLRKFESFRIRFHRSFAYLQWHELHILYSRLLIRRFSSKFGHEGPPRWEYRKFDEFRKAVSFRANSRHQWRIRSSFNSFSIIWHAIQSNRTCNDSEFQVAWPKHERQCSETSCLNPRQCWSAMRVLRP